MDNNNNNVLKNVATTGFSLLSFKAKMIVLGVIIVLFLVILIPVIALSSVTGIDNTQKKGGGSSSSSGSTSTSGAVVSTDTKKYENASFIMPFECWDSKVDVITSPFGYRSDPFTRSIIFS